MVAGAECSFLSVQGTYAARGLRVMVYNGDADPCAPPSYCLLVNHSGRLFLGAHVCNANAHICKAPL